MKDDDLPDPIEWDALARIRTHLGEIPGLEDRSDFIEVLKTWCVPSFLDGYGFVLLASGDGKKAYLRKLKFRRFFSKPEKPFTVALESEVSLDFLESLVAQLAEIKMNPFRTSPDQILDAARVGFSFQWGDLHIDISWTGGFETDYRVLERWIGQNEKQFDQYFPKESESS